MPASASRFIPAAKNRPVSKFRRSRSKTSPGRTTNRHFSSTASLTRLSNAWRDAVSTRLAKSTDLQDNPISGLSRCKSAACKNLKLATNPHSPNRQVASINSAPSVQPKSRFRAGYSLENGCLIADKGAVGLLLPANRLIDPATLSRRQRSRGEKGRDGPPNRDGVRDLARDCGLEEERRRPSSAAPATRRPPDSRLRGPSESDLRDGAGEVSRRRHAGDGRPRLRSSPCREGESPRGWIAVLRRICRDSSDQSADCVGIALRIKMNLGHATPGASAAPVAASEMTELLRWPLSA